MSGVSFFILGLFCLWFSSPAVNAKTISVSQKITITATVLPHHYIIVDNNDKIVEVISNTDGQATIKVYIHEVSYGNEVLLTPKIYQQYMHLVSRQQKYGVLYKSESKVVTKVTGQDVASILSVKNYYMHLNNLLLLYQK